MEAGLSAALKVVHWCWSTFCTVSLTKHKGQGSMLVLQSLYETKALQDICRPYATSMQALPLNVARDIVYSSVVQEGRGKADDDARQAHLLGPPSCPH